MFGFGLISKLHIRNRTWHLHCQICWSEFSLSNEITRIHLRISHEGFLYLISDWILHKIFYFQHPIFHIPNGVNMAAKWHVLSFTWIHTGDLQVLVELEFRHIFETFSQMGLHGCGVLSLRKDLQKLVVRQEVEPRKGISFSFQVLAQPFLDLVQKFVAFAQIFQFPRLRAKLNYLEETKIQEKGLFKQRIRQKTEFFKLRSYKISSLQKFIMNLKNDGSFQALEVVCHKVETNSNINPRCLSKQTQKRKESWEFPFLNDIHLFTCGFSLASFMSRLHILSIVWYLFPSTGNCRFISSLEKIGSRYSHERWQFSHSSSTS